MRHRYGFKAAHSIRSRARHRRLVVGPNAVLRWCRNHNPNISWDDIVVQLRRQIIDPLAFFEPFMPASKVSVSWVTVLRLQLPYLGLLLGDGIVHGVQINCVPTIFLYITNQPLWTCGIMFKRGLRRRVCFIPAWSIRTLRDSRINVIADPTIRLRVRYRL